jgi:uncharacterized protein (DUF433 family)
MRINIAHIVAAIAADVPQSELLEAYPALEPEEIQSVREPLDLQSRPTEVEQQADAIS